MIIYQYVLNYQLSETFLFKPFTLCFLRAKIEGKQSEKYSNGCLSQGAILCIFLIKALMFTGILYFLSMKCS